MLLVVALSLAGVVGGALLSDWATFRGFPHRRYLVELAHDQSARANYACTRLGATLGDNLSTFDFSANKQTDCILGLKGEVNSDGSFNAYTAMTTWQGRLFWSNPIHIAANRIKSIRSDAI